MSYRLHCDLCGEEIRNIEGALVVFKANHELHNQVEKHICAVCVANVRYWEGRFEEGRLRGNQPHVCTTCCFYANGGCMSDEIPEGEVHMEAPCDKWAETGNADDRLEQH